MHRGTRLIFGAALVAATGCGDDGQTTATTGASTSTTGQTTQTSNDSSTSGVPTTGPATSSASASAGTGGESTGGSTTDPSAGTTDMTSGPGTTGMTDPGTGTTAVDPSGGSSSGTTGGGCGACDEPNQQCINDVCVTSCQGQDPSPCPMGQVCDVISGECKQPDAPCTLAGDYETCGPQSCGPGTVCDGVDTCLPIAPCNAAVCTGDGHCWGDLCACERVVDCQEPTPELMNGPFSVDIGGIDFADDCNAWMVTLRSGPDYVRRLTPGGMVTTWTGVANLNMGEVKVLRRLTIPQLSKPLPLAADPAPPKPVEGLGEVAITYTCCPSCGCQVNPPQGVARLDEMNMNNPLPIIIVAQATQGTGPFNNTAADAGPQGLTWGEDRVLYVGNSTANGNYNTADLDKMTQDVVYMYDARVTASAPISPVHLLVALEGGDVFRFNTLTKQADFVIDLMAHVTSLSHDPFTGDVYASLSTLDVVKIAPFDGAVENFQKMPGKGRVAVSPSGKLWYTPVKYLSNLPLSSWQLPMSF